MEQAVIKLHSKNADQSESFGEVIGRSLKGGEIIELVSDLGGGKTTFTRGIARGAGSSDNVASPTFTISREYRTDQFVIHHFDFYRLADAGLVAHELAELIHDPNVVIIVEWGGVVADVLPDDKITIKLNRTGEHSREVVFQYPKQRLYIVENIC